MIGTATESDLGYGIYNTSDSKIDMGEGIDEIIGLGSSVGIYNEGDILLGNGNDKISATGSSSFTDYDGGGTIFLEDGNDMISGFGNQTVNGGNGNRDTASFSFGMDDITVSGVTDNSLTLNNNDIAMTFIDLEIFEFTDGTKSFADLAGMA